jgi:NADH-quinone oxidoreductase subunit J
MFQHGLSLPLFIILAFGGVGLYLMLPRGLRAESSLNRWFGGALAALSLILLATRCGQSLGNWSDSLTFWVLAVLSVASAAMTITSRNPIFSALWFALVLLANSGLYLFQDAEFLAAATIIIYAGAIIVTFLFVIMLAQPKGTAIYDRHSREPMMSCLAGAILAATLVGTLHFSLTHDRKTLGSAAALAQQSSGRRVIPAMQLIPPKQIDQEADGEESSRGHVESLGRTLFLNHYVSIELIGVLLLVSVVGAVLIAQHPAEVNGVGVDTVSPSGG